MSILLNSLCSNLPILSKEDHKNILVPQIIKLGGIPKKELELGKVYKGIYRNSEEAQWMGDIFRYRRYKFGNEYWDFCNHFEDDDGYALFIPTSLIQNPNKIFENDTSSK